MPAYTADAFNVTMPTGPSAAGYGDEELKAIKAILVAWRTFNETSGPAGLAAIADLQEDLANLGLLQYVSDIYQDVGTANSMQFNIPGLAEDAHPQILLVRVGNTCSAGAATLQLNDDTPVSVVTNRLENLRYGNLLSGYVSCLLWDSTANKYRLMNPFNLAPVQVPVRQTVLSGPVDSNGHSNFGGATGDTFVTAAGTLIATAAGGWDAELGAINYIGTITNPSWTGLTTNGVMYMYLDINLDGTCTPGVGTLRPVYQHGGNYASANGQMTFNIQDMQGKVGVGVSANASRRVYVGECDVAGGLVSAIRWYALMGQYVSTVAAWALTRTEVHNLGLIPKHARAIAVCTAALAPFAIGDEMEITTSIHFGGGWGVAGSVLGKSGSSLIFNLGNSYTAHSTSAGSVLLTGANFSTRLEADRGW